MDPPEQPACEEDILEEWNDDNDGSEAEESEDEDEDGAASTARFAVDAPTAAAAAAAAFAAPATAAPADITVLSAFIPSPFPGRPPVLQFANPAELHVRVAPLEDPTISGQLKYKCQKVTPNVVKRILRLAGFRKTSTEGWLLTWGKHMRAEQFRDIAPTQKVNHFPNSFQLGRKDCLWRNISRMQARHGKGEYGFVPDTYLLPRDRPLLRRLFPSSPAWIVKPNAAARGIGIRVVRTWAEVPKQGVIVQRYLERPLLVDGSKFDMRVYVYVAGLDPLRIYMAPEGLARFATHKYSFKKSSAADRFMHLTNYSVNKKNTAFSAASEGETSGHKWTLTALMAHLKARGADTDRIWADMKVAAIKTIVSVEDVLNSGVKANLKTPYSCHELFGFDFLLDASLRVWVLEVNVSPSMHTSAPLDLAVKGAVLRDVLNTTGVAVPGQDTVARVLAPADRAKHVQYVLAGTAAGILDSLTADDCAALMAFEEERTRCGQLQLIFPLPASDVFRPFFTLPRYYNMLLQEWVRRHPCHTPQVVERLIAAASAPAETSRSLRRPVAVLSAPAALRSAERRPGMAAPTRAAASATTAAAISPSSSATAAPAPQMKRTPSKLAVTIAVAATVVPGLPLPAVLPPLRRTASAGQMHRS